MPDGDVIHHRHGPAEPSAQPAAIWNGAFGGVPSIYQACAVRTQAVAPEMAGAWVNASANFGIAGGAAIGAGLLPVLGVAGLPWVSASLIALGLSWRWSRARPCLPGYRPPALR